MKPQQVKELQEEVKELTDFVSMICAFHREGIISNDLDGFVAWVLIRAATLHARQFLKAGVFDC